jgi:hypothetical protein
VDWHWDVVNFQLPYLTIRVADAIFQQRTRKIATGSERFSPGVEKQQLSLHHPFLLGFSLKPTHSFQTQQKYPVTSSLQGPVRARTFFPLNAASVPSLFAAC